MQKSRKNGKKSRDLAQGEKRPQNRPFRAKKFKNQAPERSRGIKSHGQISKPRSKSTENRTESTKSADKPNTPSGNWIWGVHAVQAALDNQNRHVHELFAAQNGLDKISTQTRAGLSIIDKAPHEISSLLPDGAAHQGLALRVGHLPGVHLDEIASPAKGIILVLDQITDPHNVGAMFRLASAFGVKAVIMQSRNAPPLLGATAKVAVGTIETVPHILVTNIANSLIALQKSGWRVTGLAGETKLELSQALVNSEAEVIVMGAEGPGLRKRVRDNCDQLARIPMPGVDIYGAESLNVATAAAIALYETSGALNE